MKPKTDALSACALAAGSLAIWAMVAAAPAGAQGQSPVIPRDLPGPPPLAGPTPPERLERVPEGGVIRPPEALGAVVMPQVPAPGQGTMPIIRPPGGAEGLPAR